LTLPIFIYISDDDIADAAITVVQLIACRAASQYLEAAAASQCLLRQRERCRDDTPCQPPSQPPGTEASDELALRRSWLIAG